MSDDTRRSVSWFSVAFVFIGFALFFVLVWKVYVPRRGPAAAEVSAEELPKDLAWRATPGTRRDQLTAHRTADEKLATGYDWADKGKGQVRIPISKAMELTVKDLNAKR